jgi:hypothetical protein
MLLPRPARRFAPSRIELHGHSLLAAVGDRIALRSASSASAARPATQGVVAGAAVDLVRPSLTGQRAATPFPSTVSIPGPPAPCRFCPSQPASPRCVSLPGSPSRPRPPRPAPCLGSDSAEWRLSGGSGVDHVTYGARMAAVGSARAKSPTTEDWPNATTWSSRRRRN